MNRGEVTKALVTGEIVLAKSKSGEIFRWHDIEGIQCCKNGAWINAQIFNNEIPFIAVPEQPIPGWEKCSWEEALPMGVDSTGEPVRAALHSANFAPVSANIPEKSNPKWVCALTNNAKCTWLRPVPIIPSACGD